MSLVTYTPKPGELLSAIKTAIKQHHIDTWEIDADGDFTHTPPDWRCEAWFRPSIESGVLVFGLLGREGVVMTKVVYGVYHGRFAEMLLTHFDDRFTTLTASAQSEAEDNFKTV